MFSSLLQSSGAWRNFAVCDAEAPVVRLLIECCWVFRQAVAGRLGVGFLRLPAHGLLGLGVLTLLAACGQRSDESQGPTSDLDAQEGSAKPPNILIILADDLGVDSIGAFGQHERNAATANLDQLAERGMRFSRFWAQPTCSPTRVSALTGRYSFRHGVSGPLWGQEDHLGVPMPAPPPGSPKVLDYSPFGPRTPDVLRFEAHMRNPPPGAAPKGPGPDELMLPALLKALPTPYATAAIGKWHMADRENGWLEHPNDAGFDYFSGPLSGALPSFFAWQHVENGEPSQQFGYVDQFSVGAALRWLEGRAPGQPWFLWFSFVNPHEPFHKPPAELIQSEELQALHPEGVTGDNIPLYFKAQVEAMDTLVGQLLAGIPQEQLANTYIFWMGDNGDDVWTRPASEHSPNRFKITVYEGGVRVPFIAAGPGIRANAVNTSLAHAVDLFDTVAELAGGDAQWARQGRTIDSQSFAGQLLSWENAPARQWNYTDINISPRFGGQISAIRNDAYKLITRTDQEELYHLPSDPGEQRNLMEAMDADAAAQENYAALQGQLRKLTQ